MSRENIAASQRVLEEGFNQGNLDAVDEATSDDYLDHDPLMGDLQKDGQVRKKGGGYHPAK